MYTAFLYPHSLYHLLVFMASIIAYSRYVHRISISTFTLSSRRLYRLNSRLCKPHFYIHIHYVSPSSLSPEVSIMYSAFLYPRSLYHPVVSIASIIAYSRYVHPISISTFTIVPSFLSPQRASRTRGGGRPSSQPSLQRQQTSSKACVLS